MAAESYVTSGKVNLRSEGSLDAPVLQTLEGGVAVDVLEYDPAGWSKVAVDGVNGYIKSEYLVPQGVAASEPYTATDRVNFRTEPSLGGSVIARLEAGTAVDVMNYIPGGWSQVCINGTAGYIKSEYLVPAGSEPAETPEPSSERFITTDTVNFRSEPSTEAAVIKTLNAGTAVNILEYDPAGWSMAGVGEETGYIKSEFLANVKDGEGVELLEWSAVKGIIVLNVPIPVVDVRTGVTYTIQCFSKGSHADVETLTTADTEILKGLYGGSWSWSPRPVWVTIAGRTVAASINGMPHGGGVIAGNGMDGQICLHFLGSKTHNGNTSFEQSHQNGVWEAWNAR
jgi:uncharacterized protein YgiM (DUF1202 family)